MALFTSKPFQSGIFQEALMSTDENYIYTGGKLFLLPSFHLQHEETEDVFSDFSKSV